MLLAFWGMTMRRFNCAALAAVAVVGFASVACAADMPMKAAPMVAPVSAYNWTGFYVGGNVGYGWGQNTGAGYTSFADPIGSFNIPFYFAGGGNQLPGTTPRGVIGGGQIGYDWQITPLLVLGVIGDLQASGLKASAITTGIFPGFGGGPTTQTNSNKENWFGTVRGKVGYAINNVLLYGTGGLAYGAVNSSTSLTCPGCAPASVFAGASSSTRVGWAAGAGLEYGLTAHWIVGVEYLHVDLGSISVTAASPGFPQATFTSQSKFSEDIARFVLNYKM
jgi:outer membrane immunogenic protein